MVSSLVGSNIYFICIWLIKKCHFIRIDILPEDFGGRGSQYRCVFSMVDKENQSSRVQVQTCWVKRYHCITLLLEAY